MWFSVIVYMHDPQKTYPIVAGGRHITSSDVARVFVVIGFTTKNYSGMLSDVLLVIPLSHLPHLESSSTG